MDQNVCSLCGGVLSKLDEIVSSITKSTSNYQFKTFLVGASLPQSILDKEDEVRSRLKIKGKENIKSQITRMISGKFADASGKSVDYSRPDLTVLVSMVDDTVSVTSRSIWLRATYKKLVRGVPQRASMCRVCNGLGCAECNYTGKRGTSVQSIAGTYFAEVFKAESCNFVWLGSEDEMSLVEGSGRPFYVEVVRPKRRSIRHAKNARMQPLVFRSDVGVEIANIALLKSKPVDIPQFEISARIHLRKKGTTQEGSINAEAIQAKFNETFVNVRLSRKYRTVQRKIRSIDVQFDEGNSTATIVIDCDGGIPLKKFVTGEDGTVEPNLASFTSSYELDASSPFDIVDVRVKERRTKQNAASIALEQGSALEGVLESDEAISPLI